MDGSSGFWSPTLADKNGIPPTLFLQVSQVHSTQKNVLLYNINGRNVQRKYVINNADKSRLKASRQKAPFTKTHPEQHELCRKTMRNRHSEQTILLCLFFSQLYLYFMFIKIIYPQNAKLPSRYYK